MPNPWPILFLTALVPGLGIEGRPRDDFAAGPAHWVIEQMPGGQVTVQAGALVIADAGGCTVWWREKLTAPVVISYEATVVSAGGPHDRVSDLNCF